MRGAAVSARCRAGRVPRGGRPGATPHDHFALPVSAARPALASVGKTLSALYLDHNRIAAVPPEAFSSFGKLKDLSLSGNDLSELPGTVGEMGALEKLNVSQNGLQSLPEEIGGCRALTLLDFSRNKVKALPASLGRLAELQARPHPLSPCRV